MILGSSENNLLRSFFQYKLRSGLHYAVHTVFLLKLLFFMKHICVFVFEFHMWLQGLEVEGALPEKTTCYEGVFCNYFSIGMLTCRTQLMFRSWQYVLELMNNPPFNPSIDGDQAC